MKNTIIKRFTSLFATGLLLFNSYVPYYVSAQDEVNVADELLYDSVETEDYGDDMPQEDAIDNQVEQLKIEDIEWQEPDADWYTHYEYELKQHVYSHSLSQYVNYIVLIKANDDLSGNIIVPKTANIDGAEYQVSLRSYNNKDNKYIWTGVDSITGIKLEKGVELEYSAE